MFYFVKVIFGKKKENIKGEIIIKIEKPILGNGSRKGGSGFRS